MQVLIVFLEPKSWIEPFFFWSLFFSLVLKRRQEFQESYLKESEYWKKREFGFTPWIKTSLRGRAASSAEEWRKEKTN